MRLRSILLTHRSTSLLISHSQIVMTCQPAVFSSFLFLASLSTFISNFLFQKALLVFGRGRPQRGHLCQKQPLTKIASRYSEKVTSGLPGTPFRFIRYPVIPLRRRALRRIFSGPVFFPLLETMVL